MHSVSRLNGTLSLRHESYLIFAAYYLSKDLNSKPLKRRGGKRDVHSVSRLNGTLSLRHESYLIFAALFK
ncbi:hypothetical protein SAMN05428962_4567 [Paenibacillus sp. BC26]|nr:hypothetical protein SAMN05428962_4567 [Paenibacillus sp. BC26]